MIAKPLQGQVALVTGGSRNIGRCISFMLAEAGAKVMLTGQKDQTAARQVVDEIEAAGGQADYRLGDISSERTAQSWADDTLAVFGRLDILVNNAALRRACAFTEMSLAQWREIMGVILDGPFLCVRAALAPMLRQGGGSIVNIGGLSGHIGASQRAHVISAKAGLVGLTRALAVEFAGQNIRVNCVVPGLIDTVRGASAGQSAQFHSSHANLLDRKGKPEEVAAMVRYLCLPEASYITGQVIHVNGGAYLAGA